MLSKYPLIMDFRFDVMLCSILGSENSDAGHIECSRGPQVPHPCSSRSKCAPFRKKVLNEISLKSNLNRTT